MFRTSSKNLSKLASFNFWNLVDFYSPDLIDDLGITLVLNSGAPYLLQERNNP
jgi:hypothetical protein